MKIERIIFLDFDGVITTPRTHFLHFDHVCMEHLKTIISRTNAFIVVTSTWKKRNSFRALKALFEPFGMFDRVFDITPTRKESLVRGREINDWIEVILAYAKETASILGLLGSVYALSVSFRLDGASAEEIRKRMFLILSTGFWSTIAGIFISLEASIGLLVMKRT